MDGLDAPLNDLTTYKFTVTDALWLMFRAKNVFLVYDDGVYLVDTSGKAKVGVIRPDNGNQGWDPGVAEDWHQYIPDTVLQRDDEVLLIDVADDMVNIRTIRRACKPLKRQWSYPFCGTIPEAD